jgi:hypothetical protein
MLAATLLADSAQARTFGRWYSIFQKNGGKGKHESFYAD